MRAVSLACSGAANIGGATLFFRSCPHPGGYDMLLRGVTTSARRPNDFRGPRDEDTRPSRTRVRSWTGRSAMSRSTDSPVPSFVTAGARKTRVSACAEHGLVPPGAGQLTEDPFTQVQLPTALGVTGEHDVPLMP